MYPPCRSTPAKVFDAHRAVRFILTALVFARVPADLPATGELTAAPCPAASLRVVRLIVVNEAGIAPAALYAAAAEAGAIWNEAGIRLEWTFAPTSFEQRDEDTVIVVIRRALRTRAASDTANRRPACAGPDGFSPEDRPANLIEVSLDALTQLVMAGVQFDRPIPKLPLANQRALVGRGLGRGGGSRAGTLARRTRTPAGWRDEGGFRHPRPRGAAAHAAAAARMETLAGRGGARAQLAVRAGAGRARQGRREGPDAATYGRHRAMRAGPKAGAPQ